MTIHQVFAIIISAAEEDLMIIISSVAEATVSSARPAVVVFCSQESPSNKLLYAKEISSYKKMVDE